MVNSDGLTESMQTCAELAAGLLKPDAYSHPVQTIKMVETHISWVLLTGRYAYKVKKPVDLGFVDFSTLALRKHFCEEEVRLNRRLAPELYIGVVAINGSPDSPQLEGTGPAIEYAVKMHQFDHQQTLDHLLDRAQVVDGELEVFAADLSQFHLGLPPCQPDWPHGGADTVIRAAQQNFEQLEQLLLDPDELSTLKSIQRWSDARLLALSDCMRQRKTDGWVRECHGDLHSGNIVRLKDRLVAFDCLEFNRDFRWLDVISEVGFLGMDLAARGREDLAFSLFNRYLESTADYAAAKLIDFYRVYYCVVRAKVAALTAAQRHDAHAEVVAQPAASDYLDLASRLTNKPQPQLLITHGLSGSGKTWLTDRLLPRLPAIRLRADLLRKHLHGLAAVADSHSNIDSGLYTEKATQQTYHHLAQLAKDLLTANFTVIVDAACLKAWQRKTFEDIANECGVAWRILDCHAPDALLRRRIEAREVAGTDASEAGVAVLNQQILTHEPLTDSEQAHTVRISMTNDLDIGTVMVDLLPPPH
jgi:aminoglycoside phosphotransferase family enzyme/predicted kinase